MRKTKKIISSLLSVVLLSNCVTMISDARSDDYDCYTIANKISDDLQIAMEENSEDIPVTIWLKSIESPQMEIQIKNQIGFDINGIESSYSAPSNELLNELAKASNGESDERLRTLMDNNLELTESAREIEKAKTDLYLETKRTILRDYYFSQAESFLDDMEISDDCVSFISKYAPMIICNISSDAIQRVAENNNVEAISLHQEIEEELFTLDPNDMPDALGSINVTQVNTNLGLNGNGVKIGIFESGVVSTATCQNYGVDPSRVTVLGSYIVPHDHPTTIAGIAAGTIGVAPGTSIYSASSENTWVPSNQYPGVSNRWANLETMIGLGVDVFNFSFGGTVAINNNQGITNMYVEVSKYLDYLIEDTGVTIVCADGNEAYNFVSNVASSFNCISVNGYGCKIPGTTTHEEILNNYSYNPGTGCIKPDVISPSLNGGTSNAAPFICGIIALLYQYKPSLAAHPEAVKSILMASCHRKCARLYVDANNIQNLTETMEQGLTDRQGAGIPNIYKMISIVAQHSYGYGELNSANSYNRKVNIVQPKYGATKINVSMAYLQTNVTINQPGTCDDYDINLNNSDFNTTKSSTNSKSSSEMIYTNLTDDDKYELEIHKYGSGSMTNVKYGYAWSTDNTSYYANPYMNGIYYIKNAKSGKYLTLNTNSNSAYQNNFTGADSQLWIVDRSSGTDDNIKSAGGNDVSLEIGNLISNSYYYATPKSTDSLVFLITNNDGTFSIEKQHSNNWFKLGIFNNSVDNGTAAAWYNSSDTNLSQRWYFEAVEYKKGDVNRDGEINQSDATIITNMYSNPQNTYSNIERYLADYDSNGVINAADVSALNQNN